MPLRVLQEAPDSLSVHGTAIADSGGGLLIIGPAGCGKTGLALELMAFGAGLIADDVVRIERTGQAVMLRAPRNATGIEVRGIGPLPASLHPAAPLTCVLDLGETASQRVPYRQTMTILGHPVPLLHKPLIPQVAPALLQYLRFHTHPQRTDDTHG
ncbi:MAG: HPr kinase/phosphorylase [Shimia sp.]